MPKHQLTHYIYMIKFQLEIIWRQTGIKPPITKSNKLVLDT